MRVALLIVLAGCGFKGAALGSGDADVAFDTALVTGDTRTGGDAGMVDAPTTPPADATPDAPPDASLPKECPTGGQKLGANTFYFSSNGMDKKWWEAEAACEAMGTTSTLPVHLAVPTNKGEAMQLGSALAPTPWAWLGVVQAVVALEGKDDNWFAITGGTAYRNWRVGEPSDGGNAVEVSAENFAQLYTDGTMNDTKGTDTLHYICECDGLAADPAAKLLVPLEPPF